MKEKDNRNKIINIRVTTEEKNKILAKAKANGFKSSSEYLRNIGLAKQYIPVVDKQMIKEINKIGVNINQMAHLLNIDDSYYNKDYAMQTLESFIQELRQIKDYIFNDSKNK